MQISELTKGFNELTLGICDRMEMKILVSKIELTESIFNEDICSVSLASTSSFSQTHFPIARNGDHDSIVSLRLLKMFLLGLYSPLAMPN